MTIRVSAGQPAIPQIPSHSGPQNSTPVSVPKFSQINGEGLAKLINGIHTTRKNKGPLCYETHSVATRRAVEHCLKGGPFDLPQGPHREGLINALTGELTQSHYKR